MYDRIVCGSVQAALQRQGFSERAVLLTSTKPDLLADVLTGCEVISLWDVVGVESGLEINPDAIATRLSKKPAARW